MKAFIVRMLAKVGFKATFSGWVYLAAGVGITVLIGLAAWRLYAAGLEAGRNECAAAALKEQSRQIDVNDAERRKADAEAINIIQQKEKRDAEIKQLEEQATAAVGADAQCLDADGVRRLNRIR